MEECVKLTDLEPEFLKWTSNASYHHVETLGEADGILFVCPKCFQANGNQRPGVHSVICWFEGKVPDDATPGPGRWNPTGTGFADLSFVPGAKSNSVLLTSGCAWHGFVASGDVTII